MHRGPRRSGYVTETLTAARPTEPVRAGLDLEALYRSSQQIVQARSGVSDLRRRTSFATVQLAIDVRKDGSGGDGGTWTPDDALGDAGRVLEVSLGVLVVALAVALPAGLVVILAAVAARAARRRRREQALASG